jgi:hypothetical protein
MRAAAKWLGFLFVAGGIAVFPFVIWFSGPWGVATLLVIGIGCLLLTAGIRNRHEPFDDDGDSGQSSDNSSKDTHT